MSNIDLDKPRYDQSTYTGRAKHFLRLTNPLNVFASDKDLDEAKKIVNEYRRSRRMPSGYDADKLWEKKYLYDSAFHPDTGEKMFVLGRMSAQAPMNTLITGGMITFYKTTPATVFWQWLNQTFNALVNYTNRSGDAPISTTQLLASYCAACGGALSTALFLNSKVKNMPPIFARLVPFAAVCGANFINIPMMRSNELMGGTPVFTPAGDRIGESKRAAQLGIMLVCISRTCMALPGMTLTPILTNMATKRGLFNKYPLAVMPFQLVLVGMCVTFATPMCCAFFNQQATISVSKLEPHLQEIVMKKHPDVTEVVFNKGL
ncbi:PREDICTED: sideroflexin-1 isoform X1 [Papilio xuthus]|uniref:Sidoreflexin n=1 Tax=Papilio xuthus TaxID=66420 RepID=A0AAJ6Z5D4_PAPXU|nr:PREDICTED: sideroflexin-1 isoform X1 [Papilio xuthus]XP_013165627.1 PREDICTED: sideroflexin-1 isoform X1 [Papilio xuthus]XP_013165629.1 PREDICTED: sideroflexin-1 isoform X1 [Papilio xuthus]